MCRCIIHRWFYVTTSNGVMHPFTGKKLKREDRFCKDCNKMQIKLSQFSKEKQRDLLKLSKSCPTTDWITFEQGDKIDKLTWNWLKLSKDV